MKSLTITTFAVLLFVTGVIAGEVRTTDPMYPPLAKMARIEGKVKMIVIVSPDGTITRVEVVKTRSNGQGKTPMLLSRAAKQEVSNWRFEPSKHQHSETITFEYKLDQRVEGTEIKFSRDRKTVTITTAAAPLNQSSSLRG